MSNYDKEQALQAEIKQMLAEEASSKAAIETPASEVVSESATPDIEAQARALGWKPKGEGGYEGDHFVSAEEYVSRKPLFERIDKQSEELRKLKEAQRKNAANMAKVRKEAYDQALRDLEAKKEAAVAEADTLAYRNAVAQSNNLTQQMHADPIVNNPDAVVAVDPAIEEFSQRSASWYNNNNKENATMTAYAKAVDGFLANQASIEGRALDPKTHLAAIEEAVKKEFPHRFGLPAKNASAPEVVASMAPTPQKSTSASSSSSRNTSLAARLTPAQRAMGEKFHASNPDYTLEKYAAELEQMGRLGK